MSGRLKFSQMRPDNELLLLVWPAKLLRIAAGKGRQGGEHVSARLTEASAVCVPADDKTAMDYDQAHSPFKTTFTF